MVEVSKLNLGRDSEARFGQDFKFRNSRETRDADVFLEIMKLMLVRDSGIEI